MARDVSRLLVRLRRAAVDEMRLALADCLAIESRHAAAMAALDAQVEEQRIAAAALSSGDAAVDAFAGWLMRLRSVLDQARADWDRSIEETHLARAALSAAQSALDTAESFHEEQRRSRRAADERAAEQQTGDDVARRRPA